MEIEPQSNKYNQVVLTQEQFKSVSSAIHGKTVHDNLPPPYQSYEMKVSEEEYELPDLQSYEI